MRQQTLAVIEINHDYWDCNKDMDSCFRRNDKLFFQNRD